MKLYYRTHMNGGSFLFGLIFAYPFYSRDAFKRFKSKSWTAGLIVVYALVTIGVKVYLKSNKLDEVYPRAFIGTYMKHHHGIFLSMFIVRFITGREVNLKFINARTLRIADKLFVSAFLSSLLVTRLLIQNSSKLHNVNFLNLVSIEIDIKPCSPQYDLKYLHFSSPSPALSSLSVTCSRLSSISLLKCHSFD